MSEQRTVTLSIDAVVINTMQTLTGRDEWHKAIGYLSTWNMGYPGVNIMAESDTDLLAVYMDAAGHTQYAIGAVWHGDHYGFHS